VKTLKERLIYARELRGLSQAELAKRCKCSQGTIGNVESGERETLRNLVMVARVLNVSADWLFDGKGPKPEKTVAINHDDRPPLVTELQNNNKPSHWEWPFELVDRNRYDALSPAMQHRAQIRMTDEISAIEQEAYRANGTTS
jgi:transcriptional regulator with XRE-family HTH domain